MPSDPVPLVKLWFVSMTGDEVQGYLAEAVDVALAAKDETIAALRKDLDDRFGSDRLVLEARAGEKRMLRKLEDARVELAAVRQQLADARAIVDAARQLVRDFEAMKARQHELLVRGQTLESASRNWLEHPEAFSKSSLDLQALIDAVATQGAAVD